MYIYVYIHVCIYIIYVYNDLYVFSTEIAAKYMLNKKMCF